MVQYVLEAAHHLPALSIRWPAPTYFGRWAWCTWAPSYFEDRDLVHMGTSAPSTFSFLKISKPHIFMFSKIMVLNMWIDMFMRIVCKKVPIKNTLNFWKYKKNKFLTKGYTIIILFHYHLLSEICLFYIVQNTQYFLTGLFCIHHTRIYLSIYLTS
jgi:hypothetical protein